jgi:hypothetical protein
MLNGPGLGIKLDPGHSHCRQRHDPELASRDAAPVLAGQRNPSVDDLEKGCNHFSESDVVVDHSHRVSACPIQNSFDSARLARLRWP